MHFEHLKKTKKKNTSGCTSIPKKSLVSVEGDRRLIDLSDKNKFAAWLERISDVIACVKQIEKDFLFLSFCQRHFLFSVLSDKRCCEPQLRGWTDGFVV